MGLLWMRYLEKAEGSLLRFGSESESLRGSCFEYLVPSGWCCFERLCHPTDVRAGLQKQGL